MDLSTILQRAATDIEKFGWHVILIDGEDGALGFCFTIGLTESYGHPELLLYAVSPEVGNMVSWLNPIVAQIAAGARFTDGDKLAEAFNQHRGAFRKVLDLYKPAVMGTALAYYAEKPFEALQLYWPDSQGIFPWDSDYSDDLPTVPCLYQSNLYLAGLDPETGCLILEQQNQSVMEASLNELLLLPTQEDNQKLAAAWVYFQDCLSTRHSWFDKLIKKKDKEILVRITLMGDPIVLAANGSIHCLDTSLGKRALLAKQQQLLPLALMHRGHELFPRKVLLHARDLGYWPEPGEVFSWRQDPKLQGGAQHVNNLDHVSAVVHLAYAGSRIRKN